MKNKLFIFVLVTFVFVLATGCVPNTLAQINTPVPNTKAGTPVPNGQINVPGVSIQIYVPGPNPLVNTTSAHVGVDGVLLGIWHGIISPVTLVMSFIDSNVQMYEVHNDGSQYNLGFLLGVVILLVVLGALINTRRH